jgi:hypothetical protein
MMHLVLLLGLAELLLYFSAAPAPAVQVLPLLLQLLSVRGEVHIKVSSLVLLALLVLPIGFVLLVLPAESVLLVPPIGFVLLVPPLFPGKAASSSCSQLCCSIAGMGI